MKTKFGGTHYNVERLNSYNTTNKHLYGLWGVFERNIPKKDPNGEVIKDWDNNIITFDYLLDCRGTKKAAETCLNTVYLTERKKKK